MNNFFYRSEIKKIKTMLQLPKSLYGEHLFAEFALQPKWSLLW